MYFDVVEHTVAQQFVKGFGIKDKSDHAWYNCVHTLGEAIDIALEALHYENTPIQIYRKFYHQKVKIFR